MVSLFDPALIEKSGAAFIREGKVDEALHKLIAGGHITKGHYSYPSRSELRDLVWNHMDQNHRPFIHQTYDAASRFYISGSAGFSLTRFGRWPVVIPVFDGYFKENGFYQVIVLFGLIAVVNIIECNHDTDGTRMDISWAITSHRWLRFLHPLLSRKLVHLNEVQNREDDPIRERRIALRSQGYRFKTDDPNFMNANAIDNNTIFPSVTVPGTIALSDLPDQGAVHIAVAARAVILRRSGASVEVWPGVCPHEGAELTAAHVHGRMVKCPWHGLEFAARRLVEGGPGIELCGASLQLVGDTVIVRPLSPPNRG